MSPISKILGGCRTLMAKAVTNATATGAGIDRRGGIHKIFPVSESLARFVGQSEVSFSTAMEKVEQYTDDHNLWNPENIEEILCDDNLKTIFDGQDKVVGVREMTELLLRHFPNVRTMSAKVKATGGGTIEKWGFNDIVKVSEPLARFVGQSEISFDAALRKLLDYAFDHKLVDEGVTLLEFPWITKCSKWRIRCDDTLKTILDGKDKVVNKELSSLLMQHFLDSSLHS